MSIYILYDTHLYGTPCIYRMQTWIEMRVVRRETSAISPGVSLDLQSFPCNITRSALKYFWKKKKLCSLIDASDSVRKGYQFLPDGGSAQIDIKRIAFLLRKYHISNLTWLLYYPAPRIGINLNLKLALFRYRSVSEITIDLLLSRNHGFQSPMQRLRMWKIAKLSIKGFI